MELKELEAQQIEKEEEKMEIEKNCREISYKNEDRKK